MRWSLQTWRQRRAHGTPWHAIARHMMGLYNGVPGARRWRQVWSDHRIKAQPPADVMRQARRAREGFHMAPSAP
jgi:tRNA-dihydrouridine synthase A